MKLQSIPPSILCAIVALLLPFVPEATPATILAALRAFETTPAPPDPTARKWLSLREAGKVMGKSEWSARRMVLAGTLPARKIGGVWRVPVSALDALAADTSID
jgi:hypothetical protein